jgi:hypothetical protein
MHINLTYKSPAQDLVQCAGYNPDGSINIRYTLIALRNMLRQNVEILSQLVDFADEIDDMSCLDLPIVQHNSLINVQISSQLVIDQLLEKCLVVNRANSEIFIMPTEDSIETNNDRLNKIYNLTNDLEPNLLSNRMISSHFLSSESNSEAEDDLIGDIENRKLIIDKYQKLLDDDDDDDDDDNDDDDVSD